MKQARTTIWKAAAVGLAIAGLAAPAAQGRPLGGGYVTGAYGAPPPIGLGPQTSGAGERVQQVQGTGSYTTGAYGAPSAIALGPQTSASGHQQSQQRMGTSYTTGAYGAPLAVGLGPRTGGESAVASSAVTAGSDNFDWKDAGVGAVTVFTVSILLAGSLIVVRRRHTRVAL